MGEPGAGSSDYAVVFTNKGPSCTLDGYPGLSAYSNNGKPIDVPAVRDAHPMTPEAVVTLQRAQTATAIFTGQHDDGKGGECPTASYLLVYPPGQKASAKVPFVGQPCGMQVDPVAAGTPKFN